MRHVWVLTVAVLLLIVALPAIPVHATVVTPGDYIVAESGSGKLDMITSGGVLTTLKTGLFFPTGVAIDSSGNYIVTEDVLAGKLDMITPGGVLTTPKTGLHGPAGVAIDCSGNYIVTEGLSGKLDMIAPGGVLTTPKTGLLAPTGVAIVPWPSIGSVSYSTGSVPFTLGCRPGVLSGGIQTFSAVSLSSISPAPPAGLTFPDGLFSFTIVGLSIGQTVTLTLTLPSPLPSGTFSYWKFHGGTWTQVAASRATLSSDMKTITLTLTDGATPDDSDLIANGVIVDPGGPALGTVSQPAVHPLNVGGAIFPVNLLQVLGPWIAATLALTVVAVETLVVRKNRKP